MHSFHPSRGRILFEALCLFTAAAACAGAWLQTGASALLAVAGVAALYGLFHMFDLRRPKSAEVAEPQRIDFEPEGRAVSVGVPADLPVVPSVEVTEIAAKTPSRAGTGRRSGSRKGGGRRAKAVKPAIGAVPEPIEEVPAPWPMAEGATLSEVTQPDRDSATAPGVDAAPAHIAPLFEPDPFVRMPRQAFGRRGQI